MIALDALANVHTTKQQSLIFEHLAPIHMDGYSCMVFSVVTVVFINLALAIAGDVCEFCTHLNLEFLELCCYTGPWQTDSWK